MAKYRVRLNATDHSKSGGVDTSVVVNVSNQQEAVQQAKAQFLRSYPSWSERNLTVISISEV